MKPFYAAPLPEVRKTVDYLRSAVRGLPDAQLATELKELWELHRAPGDDFAARLMFRIYEEEQARRVDPCRAFDAKLDAALSRLERGTTTEDRALVTDIGRQLNKLGGADAVRAAYHRMTFNRKSAPLREHILQNRWRGLGQWRAAA